MKRPLRIISIDGTRGAGKSSQISLLSKHLKSIGMTVSTLYMTAGEPIQSGLIAIEFCETFLAKNDKNVVILDGSIARPMVVDIMSGMSNTNLMEKYKALTSAFERLDHRYDVANFLLVMDDM
jgi:adenylylsulfate kinase-like enzyme